MKIVKISLIIIVSLIALFFVISFFLPSHCHLERSISIRATDKEIYNELNSFKNFSLWSPWAKKDPKAKYWYSGPEVGVGSRMDWKGDPNTVGSGYQKILESRPNEFINVELVFDPYVKANASYKIKSEGNGLINVTWTFDEDMKGISEKYFGLIMESFLGPDYEEGVKNLKKYIESKPKI
ncbi:MAG: SRPBCC family protein [Candidatus Kapabacteria bacterium]|nr:SRPBCC family protein [Candidatus Kapabacteria bacterium]